MLFERKKSEPEDIPMAPLIDCVFLLLIFFMVATVMRINPPFSVELPDSQVRHDFPRINLTCMLVLQVRYQLMIYLCHHLMIWKSI
jgi:biopolymer transport protein ExbD